jgi:hypothetical protein
VDGGLITREIIATNEIYCSSNFYDCQVLFDNPSDVNFISKLSQACQTSGGAIQQCEKGELGERSIFDTAHTKSPQTPQAPARTNEEPVKVAVDKASSPPLSPATIALIVVASILLAVFISFGVYEGFIHARFMKLRKSLQ